MAEVKPTTNEISFLVCPTCQGSGEVNRRLCPTCQGVKVAAWTGDELLYWGKRINALELAHDKTKLIINNLITFVLIIFSVFGFVMLGWIFFLLNKLNVSFWIFYRVHSWQMFIFWFSLLTDSYLFYRLSNELEKIKTIPKHRYQPASPVFRPISWPESQDLKKEKKIEVSRYFDSESLEVVKKAWQLTNRYHHQETGPVHLLISLLTFDQVSIVFSRLGVPFNSLKVRISNLLTRQINKDNQPVNISLPVQQILLQAYYSAWQLHQPRVSVTELLEALVQQNEEIKEMLYDINIDSDKINNVIVWLRVKKQLRQNWQRFRRRASFRPKGTMNRSMTAIATPALDAFSQDLTRLAQAGYLMPCVGREKEINEIFRIIQGGGRSSVILVGYPGVGRTTIVEGIAQRMIEEDVPDFFKDKRLVSLSVAKLVSGADAAEAQQRLMIVLNEIVRSGNIILFISDIHNMIGITAGRQGSIDLAGVLAKALGSNNVSCLATTTPGDYRRYIEDKSQLEEVLEKVEVAEITGNVAIQVLQAKAGAIEYKNQVYFSYDAIAKIVELSDRYLHDRYLPEKAIEIMQEVATAVKELKPKNSVITANDVAQIISEKTNIPLTEITAEESEKLLNLEDRIHERVIDQEEAVSMVATSLRRARAEMRDLSRPIVNLLFLGPTGVGKTELAKTVAAVYFGAEENMIRIDMSEYQEKSSISRLIGAPPGTGDDSGGYLTEAVRRNPFALLLLDEIEKAHPDILNILLQVMDDGRLTDTSGRTVDFTNVILIATSNAATETIQKYFNAGTAVEEIKKIVIDKELGSYFRPEFLNRFDGIVIFKPLSIDNVEKITQLMLKKVAVNLEEKGIELQVSPEAVKELALAGFDPKFGARPLRRIIQQKVQDVLANYLLSNQITRRDVVVLEAGGKVTIQKARQI